MNVLRDRTLLKIYTDFNRIIRSVYDLYYFDNHIILPATIESISNPSIFGRSVFAWSAEPWDDMNQTVIDATELNRAINDGSIYLRLDGHRRLMQGGKLGKVWWVGTEITEKQKQDIARYSFMRELVNINFKDLPYSWSMDEYTKNELINYEVLSIPIGVDENGKDIQVIATLKLFPAIKKADEIHIFAKPVLGDENEGIYDIYIVSTKCGCWSFYSHHRMINY